jgi:hypothetical protein
MQAELKAIRKGAWHVITKYLKSLCDIYIYNVFLLLIKEFNNHGG